MWSFVWCVQLEHAETLDSLAALVPPWILRHKTCNDFQQWRNPTRICFIYSISHNIVIRVSVPCHEGRMEKSPFGTLLLSAFLVWKDACWHDINRTISVWHIHMPWRHMSVTYAISNPVTLTRIPLVPGLSYYTVNIDGVMQTRRNSIDNALDLTSLFHKVIHIVAIL